MERRRASLRAFFEAEVTIGGVGLGAEDIADAEASPGGGTLKFLSFFHSFRLLSLYYDRILLSFWLRILAQIFSIGSGLSDSFLRQVF